MCCDGGMTPYEALLSATSRAGAVLSDGLAVIVVGRPADVLVVATDPRNDIPALRQPSHGISRGRLVPMS